MPIFSRPEGIFCQMLVRGAEVFVKASPRAPTLLLSLNLYLILVLVPVGVLNTGNPGDMPKLSRLWQ